jgi:hypothetical protein
MMRKRVADGKAIFATPQYTAIQGFRQESGINEVRFFHLTTSACHGELSGAAGMMAGPRRYAGRKVRRHNSPVNQQAGELTGAPTVK